MAEFTKARDKYERENCRGFTKLYHQENQHLYDRFIDAAEIHWENLIGGYRTRFKRLKAAEEAEKEESDDPVQVLTMRSRDVRNPTGDKLISRLAKVKMILDNKPTASHRTLPRAVEGHGV